MIKLTKTQKILLAILFGIIMIFLIPNTKVNATSVADLQAAYPSGATYSGSFDGGSECAGFARQMYYSFYGSYATAQTKTYDKTAIKAGDVIRYDDSYTYSGGHEAWVIGVSGTTLTLAECNYGHGYNVIWWGRTLDISTITLQYDWPGLYDLSGSSDTTSPTITDYYIDVSSMTTGTSYTVYAKATDNVGVTSVQFPTWTEADGQDDLIWHEGTYNSSTGYWSYTVKSSEHLGGTRRYHTHIYAYDAAGNQYGVAAWDDIYMEGKIQTSLGNFSARIVPTADTNYCIGVNGTSSGSLTVLKTKNQSTASQIWVFTKNSDNTYTIKNLSAGLVLDVVSASVDANGSAVQLYSSTGGSDQKYYIMNYNGGYRLVPASTKTCKAIDVYGATFADGTAIDIHNALNTTNTAQTFTFEKVATSLSISSTSATLDKVGATKTLTATISPSTVARKTLSWSSSNTSVAKVSSSGVVTAVGAGTATITVKTTDGTSLSKTCKITVTSPYSDVSTSSWYYNAVKFMYDRGYMSGTTSTTFEPNAELTRGMLVSILYKMEGGPSVSSGSTKFSDVTNSTMYYYSAVKWASEKGIVSGYGDGTFRPNNSITREELAIMLNNYCRYKGKYDSTTKKSITSYADGSKVSSYAVTAMQWAVGNKIITADSSNKINPKSYATRAEAASMIYKYYNYVK